MCEVGPFQTIIANAKRDFYRKDAVVSDAEALGVAVSRWFANDTIQINEAFIAALEDSNRHSLCDLIETVQDWEASDIRRLTEALDKGSAV